MPVAPDNTQRHTTLYKTPMDEKLKGSRDLYLHVTQHAQDEDIHASGGIQARIPCKPVV